MMCPACSPHVSTSRQLYFSKLRAGPFVSTNFAAGLPAGDLVAVGDLNNDLLADVVLANGREITIVFSGAEERPKLSLKGLHPAPIARCWTTTTMAGWTWCLG